MGNARNTIESAEEIKIVESFRLPYVAIMYCMYCFIVYSDRYI